jgi:hydroxyacylglutathione hydrolase
MTEVAPGVWQITGFPAHAINAYLVGDVLIDAGTRWARKRFLKLLRGRPLSMVALTHCHPDHQGSARAVCEAFNVPLACHPADAPAVEGRAAMVPRNLPIRLSTFFWAGPPCKVDRLLKEGDVVAGFQVLHAPGHTPGHVVFFRESDRVLIAGDVLANLNYLTGRPGLREPPAFFSADPEQNRQSIRAVLALKPAVLCFGHGPPLRSVLDLERLVDALPQPLALGAT